MTNDHLGDPKFIERVVIRNYKSIAAADVRLQNLTFLVGPNGSGKSNFLDAIRFVADSLRTSLDHALRDRGGIKEVRRRSTGHPNHFGVRLDFRLPGDQHGHYAFDIAARPNGAFRVQREQCFTTDRSGINAVTSSFVVMDGKIKSTTLHPAPAAVADRLYLVNASGTPQFRPLYDALSRMGFYNLNPDAIRELQPPDAGELLKRDGSNLASVLESLAEYQPQTKRRIEEYLSQVVRGVIGVDSKTLGPKETLEFRQEVGGAFKPRHFSASSMSDGTLRALGVLVALFQSGAKERGRIPLVGVEEPEIALHPAAAGVLMDSLADASAFTQVLVTSHSPDLLDNEDLATDSVLAVIFEDGETKIGGLNDAGRTALQEHLYTAGELLRMDQLQPSPAVFKLRADQMPLFEQDILETQ